MISPLERVLRSISIQPVQKMHRLPSPLERVLRSLWMVEPMQELHGLWPESKLRSYQRYLADSIVQMPAVLAAAEMSLGKTGATLTGTRRLLKANPRWRALIVAPLEVAKHTWPEEFAKWAHLQDVTYTLVTGDPEERAAALAVDADYTVINRENLRWLWREVGGIIGWRWQILIYDESSRLKGFTRRTKGTKTKPARLTEFGALAKARPAFERVIELSGTPSPNGLIDLGGQAFMLDGGVRLGANKSQFEKTFFDKNPYDRSITPKPNAEDEIMGKMKDLMIGLRAEDYIDLPQKIFNPRYVYLPQNLMKQYRDFEKTLYAQDYDVEAVTRGVLTNKLLQFANGGLYRKNAIDPDARETLLVHDLKLKALESIVEEAAGQQVLVAYSFEFDRLQIKKRFPKAVFYDEEKNFKKLWDQRKIGIGVAHPASIGHGMNFQAGGNIQVWYGLTWSLELWLQFNQRLARPGQEAEHVFIHIIMAKKTEDERQYATLQEKSVTQDRITERIRVRL